MTAASPNRITGLAALAPDYDGFFVDLWGTLHDGFEPLPGAIDCLQRLRQIGPVCLLSNSHRRREVEVERLVGMGLGEETYDALVTAGEVCRQRLFQDLPVDCPHNFAFVGLEENASLLNGLDCRRVTDVADAGFVFVGDPELEHQDLEAYRATLETAVQRFLPLVCPNPDRWSFWGDSRRVKPGAIAELYESMGGHVVWYGKPCANAFDAGAAALPQRPRRALVIGDGISNDMVGARDAGHDGCFVAGGREASGLGIRAGESPSANRLAALFAEQKVSPVATVPLFVW
mgnify:FL=1|tara:strand:- start:20447 stop:21313 length:867 start_codon:yes stop_codon:yes gene_type:complete